MTTSDAIQAARLQRQHIITTSCCSACGGGLKEKYVGTASVAGVRPAIIPLWTVVCAAGCRPAGYVKLTVIEHARHDALTAADDAKLGQPRIEYQGLPDEARAGLRALGWEE